MDASDDPSLASPGTAAQHLADESRRRRSALGLTQEQAAARGNMPVRTYTAVEGAKRKSSYRATTLARLDQALSWEPGTASRMMSTERYRPDDTDSPVVEALGSLTSVVAQLVQAVRDDRQQSVPPELATMWALLSAEDRERLLELARRLMGGR